MGLKLAHREEPEIRGAARKRVAVGDGLGGLFYLGPAGQPVCMQVARMYLPKPSRLEERRRQLGGHLIMASAARRDPPLGLELSDRVHDRVSVDLQSPSHLA